MRDQIQDVLDRLVESGAETGIQVAVFRDGEQVVDAVAGVADAETRRPMLPDTPVYGSSAGKAMTATVVHVLAERGVLAYDDPIVKYWPEFGAHGKGKTTVRHALTHSTGVPGLPEDITPEDLCDWQKMCAAIEDARPWWEAGEKAGYHSQSFGYILGEVVRRATGRPISDVLRDEVARPLGIEDELYFGVPEKALPRVARLDDPSGTSELPAELIASMPMFKVVNGSTAGPLRAMPSAGFGNRPDVLTADIPAGGTMSGRAVARMMAALMDEVDGVRLVSPERFRELSAVARDDHDEVFGGPAARALGFLVGAPWPAKGRTVIGWGGSGGNGVFADLASRTVIAISKNRFTAGDFSTAKKISTPIT
ncbi:serine hydrolase domain-containing protein [Actinomadura decatromicini]|uniref:Beta-lactamase family protein n=1 Tax=Actinomadura decatromicini TaxID=2604572 RepID=A0A5D3FSA4_9ACTN|nr:serine hydrolase domain-containing protein [Actinomadura decatromicini]TYK50938.1 beta-lactamase family protein [Actinomadura decatromicini]